MRASAAITNPALTLHTVLLAEEIKDNVRIDHFENCQLTFKGYVLSCPAEWDTLLWGAQKSL